MEEIANNNKTDNTSHNDTSSNNIINKNTNTNKYNLMNLDTIMNILSYKINNVKSINDSLIEEMCIGLKSYCQNHNAQINNWFDEEYDDNLFSLKKNNLEHIELSNMYKSNSFILVEEC
jgi:hypothetical protein